MKGGVSWRRVPRITIDTARAWFQAARYLAAAWRPRAVSRSRHSGPIHMVMLARHLPPRVNGGVYRPLALIEAAARRGWQVTALAQPTAGEPSAAGLELRSRIPASARLVNWQWSALEVSHRFTPSLDGDFTTISAMIAAARETVGDTAPNIVLATGPAFAEFVGAMALADHWRVPFALDYRDEWSESPFEFVHKGNSDRFWEARCLERASLVTFTTEAQLEHQLKAFPRLDRSRTAVVGNGWDEQAAPGAPVELALPSERAVVAYLGNLGQHCDLPEFLATLRAAIAGRPGLRRRIELRFIGMKTDIERRLFDAFEPRELLHDQPQVPLSAAQTAMRRSEALLLFNPPMLARYIPGKAYEYIASGSRILLYGGGGELERLLSGYSAALRVRRGDPQGLADALETIAASTGGGRADSALVEGYSRGRRAEEHISLLERLIDEGATGIAGASPRPS